MIEYLKLAWRNIWRNKRRTLITIAAVFFALFFSLIMRALQVGSYGHMADSIVEAYSGSMQLHGYGYWEDPTIDNTFEYDSSLVSKIETQENVKAVIPRLESFALASTGMHTKGILVVGIDPQKELELTHPDRKLVEGVYFDGSPEGALVSSKLAEFLNLSLGDTLTLLSTGYHGASAAGIYPVIGIIKMPNPEMDRRMVFLTLPYAQELYGARNMLSSLVINVKNSDLLNKTKKELISMVNGEFYEIMDWKEMNTELVQQIESDQTSGFIMLAVLYMIIGFAVLGTLIMMTTERRREFGVMVAIRFTGEYAELFEVYGWDPIMPAKFELSYFMGQSSIVLVIFILAILYPINTVLRLKEIKALRGIH
jgi:ABC-type lipoprotein release transport system permease subunit